jgi:ERCC4-related helicase
MKQLNIEQMAIVDDILYNKTKHPNKSLHIFWTRGVEIGKTFTFMCIIQNMLQYYIRQIIIVNPLKPKIMKLASTRKATCNINKTTIHSTLIITLNKNLNKLKALINER